MLLGGFEMRRATGEVVDILGQRDRALLAFLAIASGDTHPRERLAGMLWSEHGDRQARQLKQALLRRAAVSRSADHGALAPDRQSIGLDRDLVSVDALALRTTCPRRHHRLAGAGDLALSRRPAGGHRDP